MGLPQKRASLTTVTYLIIVVCWAAAIQQSDTGSIAKIGVLVGETAHDRWMESIVRLAVEKVNSLTNEASAVRLQPHFVHVADNNSFVATQHVCRVLRDGVYAIFVPADPVLSWHVQSVCSALDVPHVLWTHRHVSDVGTAGSSWTSGSLAVSMFPHPEGLCRAYTDLISVLGWNQLLVVYQHEQGLARLQPMMRSLIGKVNMDFRRVDGSKILDLLLEIKLKEFYNVLIDVDLNIIPKLLSAVVASQMNMRGYHYIFTTLDLDTLDLGDVGDHLINITGYRLVRSHDNDRRRQPAPSTMSIKDAVDSSDPQYHTVNSGAVQTEMAVVYDSVLLLAEALNAFLIDNQHQPSNGVSCHRSQPSTFGTSLFNYLNVVNISGLTGPLHLTNGRRESFSLELVKMHERRLISVGAWSRDCGVEITDIDRFFVSENVNFTLVVTANLNRPYVMLKIQPGLVGNERFEGFSIDMLRVLAELVGFNYTILLNPDGLYGAADPDTGEWNGIVRQLIDKKADIAIGSFSINYARESVIDFTKPFMNLGISILFKVPSSADARPFSFMNPLAVDIWMYMLVAYALVSLAMFVVARFSPYEWQCQHPCWRHAGLIENQFSMADSFWFTIGTLMQQGSDLNPKAISTRIVGGIWWFFTLIMISSYTANLAAFLTVERMITPIASVEDLTEQSEISYGALEGGSTMTFFRDSKIDTYRKIWRFMESKKQSVFTKTYEDGIRRVASGNYAFLAESTTIDYIVNRDCNLTQIGDLLDSKGYGIATTRGSPWRDPLSLAILEMQEKSVIHTLYNKWWKGTGSTCHRRLHEANKANALGMGNIGGIFVVLVLGLAFAVCVAIVEFCWISRNRAHLDKHSVCGEMVTELRYAVRCAGGRRRPVLTRHCQPCLTPSRTVGGEVSSMPHNSLSHHPVSSCAHEIGCQLSGEKRTIH